MNTEYDPNIIQESANALYAEAKSVVRNCTLGGFVLGIFLGCGLVAVGQSARSGQGGLIAVAAIAALVLALIGYRIGKTKAFRLKLEAQTALCQVQIEKNTRREP